MKDIKDNFTAQAQLYAKYRPGYPRDLYAFLYSLLQQATSAWDCGTGNGQVAAELSDHFGQVYATDISDEQIKNAVQKQNIHYSVQRAESTAFPAEFFDLVIVAQAIHWFDFDLFYQEVNRTIRSGGILAVTGYGMLEAGGEIDPVIDHFYKDVVGPYWDKERRYIDENYSTIPFPFKEIIAPAIINRFSWTLADLLGYINTWSAVQHYIKATNTNPVDKLKTELTSYWSDGSSRTIEFPVLLRVARVEK